MPTPSRAVRRWLAAAILASASAIPASAQPTEDPSSWPMAGRDARHTGAAEGPAPPYRRAWTARLEGQGLLAGPVVSAEVAVVVGRTSVVALDPITGETRWEVEREEGAAGSPAIVGDLVIHASGQRDGAALVGRRLDDGREEWSTSTGASVGSGIAVEGERAYAATRAGEVLAVDVSTGEVAWRFDTAGNLGTIPAVDEGRVFAVAQSQTFGPASLHAIDAETGEEEWRFPLGQPVRSLGTSPAAGGGVVVAGLSDGRVHAVDADTGAERWAEDALPGWIRQPFGPGTVPAIPGSLAPGAAFVAGPSRAVRMEVGSGQVRWSYQLADLLTHLSASISGRHLLLGDASGLAAAVDVGSGRLVWKAPLGSGPVGSVAVTEDRLLVIVAGERDSSVVALEHDPEGTLISETSPSVLNPAWAALNYLGAAATVGVALWLLARGPEALRRRDRP
jgi:outer membrane protein assembly factor BamB